MASFTAYVKDALSPLLPLVERVFTFLLGVSTGKTLQQNETRAENAEADLKGVLKHEENRQTNAGLSDDDAVRKLRESSRRRKSAGTPGTGR